MRYTTVSRERRKKKTIFVSVLDSRISVNRTKRSPCAQNILHFLELCRGKWVARVECLKDKPYHIITST